MVYRLKILLDQRLDPLYEAVMEATEEAVLNAMCMAQPMDGVNGNFCPALPLDEVRRIVEACRPIFARKKPRPGTGMEKPKDHDREGRTTLADIAEAPPTAVRSAEGIPYPTKPLPTSARPRAEAPVEAGGEGPATTEPPAGSRSSE